MNKPRRITLIITEENRGKGIENDPIRNIDVYWHENSFALFGCYDPFTNEFTYYGEQG